MIMLRTPEASSGTRTGNRAAMPCACHPGRSSARCFIIEAKDLKS